MILLLLQPKEEKDQMIAESVSRIETCDLADPLAMHPQPLKGEKETISLAQAKDVVPGPNCMLKSLWG